MLISYYELGKDSFKQIMEIPATSETFNSFDDSVYDIVHLEKDKLKIGVDRVEDSLLFVFINNEIPNHGTILNVLQDLIK